MLLVDAQTRNGRECARNQLATDPERIVLFVEWIEACVSAGKLLGDDVDWGNLRIQDPEIVDESLYEEPADSHVAHVKQDIKEEDHADPKYRYLSTILFVRRVLTVHKGHGRPPRHPLVPLKGNSQSRLVLCLETQPPLHLDPM